MYAVESGTNTHNTWVRIQWRCAEEEGVRFISVIANRHRCPPRRCRPPRLYGSTLKLPTGLPPKALPLLARGRVNLKLALDCLRLRFASRCGRIALFQIALLSAVRGRGFCDLGDACLSSRRLLEVCSGKVVFEADRRAADRFADFPLPLLSNVVEYSRGD